MSKRLTLAEQLAQIAEPAPQDFDPEDSYATYANERSKGAQADLEAGRAEYLPVGPGGLRKKGEALFDSRYEGKKGSRRTMFGGEEEDDNENEEDDKDPDQDEDSEQDDDGGDDFDDLVGSEDSQELASADQDDDDDDDDEEEEEEDLAPVASTSNKQAPRSALKTSTKFSSTKGKSADELAMISQLRTAAHADVEKGLDVKKQLSFCDSVLESRIKLQKAVTAINVLPRPGNAEMYYEQVEEERERARLEVEALNEELFKLRSTMLKGKEQIQLPTNLGQSRKRHRNPDSAQEYLAGTVKDLAAIETALEPFLRTTITKWSDKVLAASGLAIGKDKKFKAVNQNAMAQIDHALGPLERERLVKRTRLRRATDRAVVGQADLGTLEGEKTPADEEVFDDGDFYQQLLRDVIESRMLDLGALFPWGLLRTSFERSVLIVLDRCTDDHTLESLRQATARSKKQKKVVDTRASKGRKIRYHVHEKIQNFMVPIEAGGWHDEKVDELFASLLGRSFPQVRSNEEEVSKVSTGSSGAAASENVDVGSLRIFG